jgi:hypothetical protein
MVMEGTPFIVPCLMCLAVEFNLLRRVHSFDLLFICMVTEGTPFDLPCLMFIYVRASLWNLMFDSHIRVWLYVM